MDSIASKEHISLAIVEILRSIPSPLDPAVHFQPSPRISKAIFLGTSAPLHIIMAMMDKSKDIYMAAFERHEWKCARSPKQTSKLARPEPLAQYVMTESLFHAPGNLIFETFPLRHLIHECAKGLFNVYRGCSQTSLAYRRSRKALHFSSG